MSKESTQSITPLIALVGNPNSGKSSLFNALSGLNQRVGNFSGVTVDRKIAKAKLGGKAVRLLDLPGTNSLYPEADDERVTAQVLQDPQHADHPDQLLIVADATQLRRSLLLASQALDLGIPSVLAVNMMDLADKEGFSIKASVLEKALGIPVVLVSARQGKGLSELKTKLKAGGMAPVKAFFRIPPSFKPALEHIKSGLNLENDFRAYQALVQPETCPRADEALITEARTKINLLPETAEELIANEFTVRLDRIDSVLEDAFRKPPGIRELMADKVDRFLTHPIWGYLAFMTILLLIFQSIFSWAEAPMGWIEEGMSMLGNTVSDILPDGWLNDLIKDGIIAGLAGIVVFVPQIAFLFLFISIMEESGYMARVVFLMDRFMRPFGFSGRSVIPLMGGMACAVPSILMTRSISQRKERLITILVTPLMSCSARIPVYMLLVTMFLSQQSVLGIDQRGLVMTGLYVLGFLASLIMAFVFKTILKYESKGVFVVELPAYRVPSVKQVMLTVWQKVWSFLANAGKVILVVSIVLWLLSSFGPGDEMDKIEADFNTQIAAATNAEAAQELSRQQQGAMLEASYAATLGKSIEPAIRPLGYDWKIGISLISSFAAREVFVGTMSVLYQSEEPEGFESEKEQEQGRLRLIDRLQKERHPDSGLPVYTLATVLSLIVFYAFAMQCISTLAVTKQEAGWKWMWVMLIYMTALAYFGAWLVYFSFS
ncbi:MAG: ferrous iron transport protein B [Bacteroidia bacterium]